MVKSEFIRILKHNLYLYFLDDLDKNVNNYINFLNLDVRDSLIHTIINNTIKNIQFEINKKNKTKNKVENFSITENEEEFYFMLLDESYESLLEKARKTILQSLKAKQIQQEIEYKNTKEYKQAVARAQLKKTWSEFKKESGKVAKKRFIWWCGCWCWNVWNIERTNRQKK